MPNIISSFKTYNMVPKINFGESIEKLKLVRGNVGSMLRGSVLGYIAGLIPYVGVDLSSYIAYYIEKWLGKDTVAKVAAAETATNAAGISVLLPLLIFGIAIQPSENVLLEITNSASYYLNWDTVKPMFLTMAAWLMFANLISFFLSWNLAAFVVRNLNKIGRMFPWLLAVFCTYSVYSIGTEYNQGAYYLIVMGVFTVLGLIFRKEDLLPFIFVYMLQDRLEPAIIRLYTIYS